MRVHVMPIRQLLRKDDLPQTAAALLSTFEAPDVRKLSIPYKLAEYMDLDYEAPRAFTRQQAATFADFLRGLPGNTELFVCCDAGQSRSPAIAAAVLRWLGQTDLPIWQDPRYHPNMHCFLLMAEALGLTVSDPEIETLLHINHTAFQQTKGK